ncbi:MAG: capsular polysaccharide biosynthesis protein, partial [Lachnospiraceae bacterium]|nr:capsular polysaccharide biosynthesis protein [Lachnospiraceae bacterium]
MVIDFHTHVLPGIDDGARDLETSIEMLDKMKKQGVDLVVATPHFYADRMTVDGFLKNREKAFEAVESRRRDGWPKVMKGAEVA